MLACGIKLTSRAGDGIVGLSEVSVFPEVASEPVAISLFRIPRIPLHMEVEEVGSTVRVEVGEGHDGVVEESDAMHVAAADEVEEVSGCRGSLLRERAAQIEVRGKVVAGGVAPRTTIVVAVGRRQEFEGINSQVLQVGVASLQEANGGEVGRAVHTAHQCKHVLKGSDAHVRGGGQVACL